MYGRTYDAKRVFRKNVRRAFPKELVKEVNAVGDDLFTALFANNIKEIRQKAQSAVVVKKNRRKEKKPGKPSKLLNLSVVHELSEPSHCKESDKENAAESTFDEIFRGPRYQPVHASTQAKPREDVFSALRKNGKRITRPPRLKKNNVSGRVLRSHESQPNFNDSYLDSLIDDVPIFEGVRNISPANKHLSSFSVTDLEDSAVGGSLQAASSQVHVSPGDGLQDISNEPDGNQKSAWTPARNGQSTEENITSTPAFLRSKHTSVRFDISPIMPPQPSVSPKEQKLQSSEETENESVGKDSIFLSPDSERMRDRQNSKDSLLEEIVTRDLSPIQYLVASPDIFAMDSVTGNVRESTACVLGDGERSSSLTESRSRSAEKIEKETVGDKSVEGLLEKRRSPDPFASCVSYCVKGRGKRNTCSFLNSVDDSIAPMKRGGRRYSILLDNVTRRRGNLSIWNETHHASVALPAPRRSHLVVPLETSFIAGQQSTIFRDVHLNSSSLLALEDCHSLLSSSGEKEITFKDVVLQRCGQEEILYFQEVFPDTCLKNCKKIGEGVYGEVFSCQRSADLFTVLKIMPVEGNTKINGEVQKTYEEILSEIVIAMELSDLRKGKEFQTEGFPELVRCWCVQGKYPERLLQLWREYDDDKDSYNDCPDILPEDQVFVILELANVGTVLEGFTFLSPEQAWAMFLQVTYTLAVAEAAFEFEHRDLHWGNVLLKPTKARTVTCSLYGKEYAVQCRGLQASIIDFTLSRMTYDGCCIYNNLAEDPDLFNGKGDFQFDVYRMMRDCVKNNWQVFEPFNNVIWLKYILDKLITKSKYKNKSGKVYKKKMEMFETLREKIVECRSAREVAQYCRENL